MTILAVVAAALLVAPEPAPVPIDRFPEAAPSYLVAVDGEVTWARAPDAPRAPASLSKILTALLALETAAPGDWLTVSDRAAAETGSRLGLRAGEKVLVRDAVAAMLVASANDACRAVAEHAAGSAAGFVARMNGRAAAMGLAGSRFADPCGHDAKGQHVTASDLWRLTREALGNAEFRRLVALPSVRVATRGGRVLTATTSNALLGRLPGADGVKTGFTAQAGKCVVARAERGGREVLVILLGAPDRWWTAAAIVEKAFAEAPRRD